MMFFWKGPPSFVEPMITLNIFPTVYPPTSGGTLRYYHLYKELSRYYDITLLSQAREQGLAEYSPTMREVKVERDPFYSTLKRQLKLSRL